MSSESEREPLRKIPTKHVPATDARVGATLKAARLKRGLSLEVVAQQSRIPKKYLEALENDRFDEFPALVYLRGFLKGYCDHLETDFESLWRQIDAPPPAPEPATSASSATAPVAPAPAPEPKPAHKPAPAAHAHAPAPSRAHGHAAPHAPSHAPAAAHGQEDHHSSSSSALGAILFALALAAVLGVWIFGERGKPPAPVAIEPPKALQPLPRTVEPKVTLVFKDDAWVRVSIDDAVVFEGRAPRGTRQEWKPLRSAAMRTTAPEAVEATLNDAPAKLTGPSPEGDYSIEIQ